MFLRFVHKVLEFLDYWVDQSLIRKSSSLLCQHEVLNEFLFEFTIAICYSPRI